MMKKDSRQVTFSVTIQLDKKWARNYEPEELREYLETRFNSSLGFKGQVKKLTIARQKSVS